jgi:Uma2 family endonuclease
VHDFLVTHIAELLRPRRPAAWSLREEKAVQLGRRWRPDPDIAILKADDAAFAHRSPRPRDVALLIEVSDTSYAKDSGIKLRGYAQFRIPLYWIVHVDRRQVEVYRDPYGRGGKAGYRRVEFHPEDVEVPILIEGQDLGRIPVKEMLP